MVMPRKCGATAGMNSTGWPSCRVTSRSWMWSISAYGIRLSRSASGSFFSEGLRAGAGITGHAEALHRPGQRIAHRRQRQLHRGGVAAGIADAALALGACPGQLRQAVMPGVVEAVVGRQVEHDGLRHLGIDRRDELAGHAVGQREHHRVGAKPGRLFRGRVVVMQVADLRVLVRAPGAARRARATRRRPARSRDGRRSAGSVRCRRSHARR